MASGASRLRESLLTKSRASRRSRWDEDDDLACSALDINEGAFDNELESHNLLVKIAGSRSQTQSGHFPGSENPCTHLTLSTAPTGNSVIVGAERTTLQSTLLDSCSSAFQSRPMYATHGARGAQTSCLRGSSKRMARSHAITTHGITINLPATPLIGSIRSTEINNKLSTTMKTIASTLEQQYDSLLKEAASKTGEAAALYYLHTKSLEFNDLLDQVDTHDQEVGKRLQSQVEDASQHNAIFSCYNKWRQSLDNIVVDEAFSTNQLTIEQPDAFNSGINSSVVQATKLVLLQEGDGWFTKEILKRLDCYRTSDKTTRETLINLLAGLNLQNLKISESQRGKLLILLSEIYTL